MALIIRGATPCALCGSVLDSSAEEIIGFPAFLPSTHRLWKYSDAAFHKSCFDAWEDCSELLDVYQRFRDIWATRPMGLTSLKEINEWGKQAFAEFDQSLDSDQILPDD